MCCTRCAVASDNFLTGARQRALKRADAKGIGVQAQRSKRPFYSSRAPLAFKIGVFSSRACRVLTRSLGQKGLFLLESGRADWSRSNHFFSGFAFYADNGRGFLRNWLYRGCGRRRWCGLAGLFLSQLHIDRWG